MPMPPERRKPVACKAIGSLGNEKVGNLSNSKHSSNTASLQALSLRSRLRRRSDGGRPSLVGWSLGYVIVPAAASFVMFAIVGLLP